MLLAKVFKYVFGVQAAARRHPKQSVPSSPGTFEGCGAKEKTCWSTRPGCLRRGPRHAGPRDLAVCDITFPMDLRAIQKSVFPSVHGRNIATWRNRSNRTLSRRRLRKIVIPPPPPGTQCWVVAIFIPSAGGVPARTAYHASNFELGGGRVLRGRSRGCDVRLWLLQYLFHALPGK